MPDKWDKYAAPATEDKWERYAIQPGSRDKEKPEMGLGEALLQPAIGIVKGIGSTAYGASKLVRTLGGEDIANRITRTLFPKQAAAREAKEQEAESRIQKFLEPSNALQTGGKFVEQAAEYMLPLGEEKLIANAPKGLQYIARVASDALRTGAVASAQTGSFEEGAKAGLTAGVVSGVLSSINVPLAAYGRKIQMSTIRPRRVDMVDGFKWETLDKFNLKGDLGESLEQVSNELTRLRNARNSMIAPGTATVDIGKAFDEALIDVDRQAEALKYGPLGDTAKKELLGMRKAIDELVNGSKSGRLVSPLGTPLLSGIKADVAKAENLKEYLGTVGAWAYGHTDSDAKVKELVANTLYTKMRVAIEQALGPQGAEVKALNSQMQELIPVKNAMVARLPVEQRNQLFSLSDFVAMLPFVMTGDIRLLTLEGLARAQKSLRWGNLLNRGQGVPRLGSVAGRAAGGIQANQ